MILKCKNCDLEFKKDWNDIKFELSERNYYCSRICYKVQFKREITGIIKRCSLCKKEFDSSFFFKRRNRGGKDSSWCKLCFSTQQMVRFNKFKVEVVKLLGNKCSMCGIVCHPAGYDLHHRNPGEKKFDWGTARKRSRLSSLEEIKKCDLICAICHRLQHINQELWEF